MFKEVDFKQLNVVIKNGDIDRFNKEKSIDNPFN